MTSVAKIKKSAFFWNMMGSLCNAASSVILLMVVTRTSGSFDGGVFAFAFSQAQLFFTIGGFEMRPYQSTDIKNKYKFKDYYTSRIITCIVMMIITTLYILANGFEMKKAAVIFLMCTYKMIDALSDVFQGLFQVRDRLDMAGKTLAIRVILSTIVFSICIYGTNDLILSSVSAVIISIVWILLYDFNLCKKFEKIEIKFDFKKLKGLFLECLPLFLGAFLLMYIFNLPKYGIDRFMNEEVQNFFNILFMPASVINLFSIFLFRPVLTRLADSFNKKDIKKFLCIIGVLVAWIIVLTISAVIVAYVIGIPVLSTLYGVELEKYKSELVVMMIGGGFSALSTLLHYIITVMRKQYSLLIGYGITAVLGTFIAPRLIQSYGILGASYTYLLLMINLSIIFVCIQILGCLTPQKLGCQAPQFLEDKRGRNMGKTYFLFSAQYFPTAYGVERYTYNLAKKLIENGDRAVVITSNVYKLQEYEVSEGIEIYRIPCINLLDGRFPVAKFNKDYRGILKKLNKEKVDMVVVTTRFYLHSLIGARFSKKVKAKCIMLEHGTSHFTVNSKAWDFLGGIYEHFITFCIKHYVKEFHGVSKACNEWLKHFNIEPGEVLYNSIDIESIDKLIKENVRDYKSEYNLQDKDINIAFVGRLVEEKGILKLIEAFKMAQKECENIKLFIAGDGPLLDEVKKNEQDNIKVLGRVEFKEIISLLSLCKIYCLPTDYAEGFPTSVLEAAACRAYIITTDKGGSKELIVDDSFGIILKNTKPETIKEALIKAVRNDEDREKGVEKSYNRLIDNFEWKVTSKKVINICLENEQKRG